MGVRLSELDVRLSDSVLSVLIPENEAFLSGQSEVHVDAAHPGWAYAGWAAIALGVVAFVAAAAVTASIWLWTSPYAVTVEGVIDGLNDTDQVVYHYEVDGERFDKVEATRGYSSSWSKGNVPTSVVHLSFNPGWAMLADNVEPMNWIGAFALLGVPLLIVWWGRYSIRFAHRAIRLRDAATHVLEGQIHQSVDGGQGTVNHFYRTTSPKSGRQIGGVLSLGEAHPRFSRIGEGAVVAVLYLDDNVHTVL